MFILIAKITEIFSNKWHIVKAMGSR